MSAAGPVRRSILLVGSKGEQTLLASRRLLEADPMLAGRSALKQALAD
jgi:hypothetical protein